MKFIISLLLLNLYTSVAICSELKDRQVIEDNVACMFHAEQFAELDKTARQYLKSEERTSSGLWKLTLFYLGISRIPNQNITDEDYWNGLEAKAKRWIKSYPDSPSGYLVYADILIKHAWMYRGNGWSSEVRSEDWKPFYSHISKAKMFLNKNKVVSSRDPRWYVLMIIIAKAENWNMNKFNKLVGEATSRDPYFYQIYFAAIDYLTPKWHGSKIEIEEFANKAVNITHPLEKNAMYARIYWHVSLSNYGVNLFKKSSVVWKKMSDSIDDVLENYPDQWNINNFAFFSCLAGDPRKTNILIRKIKGKPIHIVWKKMSYFNNCKKWSSVK